jgi:hypothetical protein
MEDQTSQHSAPNDGPTTPAVAISEAWIRVTFSRPLPDGTHEFYPRVLALKTPNESLLDPAAFPAAYQAICAMRTALEEQFRPKPEPSKAKRAIARARRFFNAPFNRKSQI